MLLFQLESHKFLSLLTFVNGTGKFCPESSLTNYQPKQRNMPEDRRARLHFLNSLIFTLSEI